MFTLLRTTLRLSQWAPAVALLSAAATCQAQYVDTRLRCIRCHETQGSEDGFCKSIPAAVWGRDDKHQNAFFYLHDTDEKRALVRSILGFDLGDVFTDGQFQRLKDDQGDAALKQKIATVKACLRCHATWPVAADQRYPLAPPVPLSLGVSCQACHGPGQQWDLPHGTPDWRCVTPAAKAAVGFIDVRSVASKARLCVSCHVGSVDEQKFVKHEWYAAGHPPLPSFELAAFESQMPVHWTPLREKGPFRFRDDAGDLAERIAALPNIPQGAIKAGYREANFPGAAAKGLDPFNDLPRAKDAIVGGVVVFEDYVRLVGNYAAAAANQKAPWPELALYDCTACHHELRSNLGLATRPKRRHVLGRPPLAGWPTVLAQLGAQQTASGESTEFAARWTAIGSQVTQLEQATTGVPFGEAALMREAADLLCKRLTQLAEEASATKFDERAVKRALGVLTDPAAVDGADYTSARQAAWAIRELAKDIGSPDAENFFMPGSEDALSLRLPSGPGRSVMGNLAPWLNAAARYDAAWFRAEQQAIRVRIAPR